MPRWAKYLLFSILLLAPACWQSRVQAGDLSSHIYNAWLVQLVKAGQAPGLTVANQTTNVLFDVLLEALFRLGGAGFAQRVAVSICVLVFGWGVFQFAGAVAEKRPWHIFPSIVMLAYGWVFHMGFFNFYLSMGLCLWALALAWDGTRRGLAGAAGLMALAYTAHALPAAWSLGLILYQLAAKRLPVRARAYLTTGCMLATGALHLALSKVTFTRWTVQQIKLTTGADQLWVFDGKYNLVLLGLLVVWGLQFFELARTRGVRDVVLGVPFQLCVLSAAVVLVLPAMIQLPGYQHPLAFISERMSLGVGVCVCALLAAGPPRVWTRYGLLCVAALFFGLLYRDERILNSIEDRMASTVARLEPGTRVVGGVDAPQLHVFAVTHMIDRVCLGRCISYANYEPGTLQFRIRAVGQNRFAIAAAQDSWKLQAGQYVVQDRDLPLLQVVLDRDGEMVVRPLAAGVPCGQTPLRGLLDL